MAQDLLAHLRILEDSDEPHVAATAGAYQNLVAVDPAHQVGPLQPTLTARIIGSRELVGVRDGLGLVLLLTLLLLLLLLLMYRDDPARARRLSSGAFDGYVQILR